MKEWGDPDAWKPALKAQVQKKNDTALRPHRRCRSRSSLYEDDV